jgi:predicted transcriptional regulator
MSELDNLTDDVRQMKSSITAMQSTMLKMAETMERLARLEDRWEIIQETTTALWKKLDDFSARVLELEKSEPMQRKTSEWVQSALWAAAGVAAAFIAKSAGLMG